MRRRALRRRRRRQFARISSNALGGVGAGAFGIAGHAARRCSIASPSISIRSICAAARPSSISTLLDLGSDPRVGINSVNVVLPSLDAANTAATRLAKLPEALSTATLQNFVPGDQVSRAGTGHTPRRSSARPARRPYHGRGSARPGRPAGRTPMKTLSALRSGPAATPGRFARMASTSSPPRS